MIDYLKYLLTITVVCLFLGLNSGTAEADNGSVIARVGDVPVSVYELQRESHRILPFNKSFHGGVSQQKLREIRLQAFEHLIDQAHKVAYARTQGLSVSNDELDERLKGVHRKFATEDELREALGDESIEDFRASVARILLAQKAEERAVDARINIEEAELKTFYRENRFMYQRPKQYRASHILVRVDPSLVGEKRQQLIDRANSLAERAKAGENFYNLAYHNSDEDTKFVGGDIGYFQSGQTVKEFEEAVADLEPGAIVGPVETISGFHIIKLTDVRKARLLAFDEVRQKIKATLKKKKRETLYTSWMKRLKNRFNTEILHPDLTLE